MDFNTQRRIVKKLREKGSNPLLFIPCFIARYAVIIFMSLCRGVDMALSDSKGNFLGIKRKEKKKKVYEEVPVPAEKPAKKQSDTEFTEKQLRRISGKLPYRPLTKRIASLVTAAAFMFMCMPEFTVSAVGGSLSIFPTEADLTAIKKSDVTKHENTYGAIRRVDLRRYTGDPILSIENGALNNKHSLTTVLADYNPDMVIGNNFSGIAPDSVIFIKAATQADFNEAESKFVSRDPTTQIVWDPAGTLVNQLPLAVPAFSAKSGINGAFLEWDVPSGGADGYKLYSLDESTGIYGSIITIDPSTAGFTQSGSRCEYFCNLTSRTRFSIRAYKDVLTPSGRVYRLYSETFSDAPVASSPINTAKPLITIEQDNRRVYVDISYVSTVNIPDYTVLFRSSRTSPTGFDAVAAVSKNLFVNGKYTFEDALLFPAYSGEYRTYVAAAYYDINNPNPSSILGSYTYFPNGNVTSSLTIINSDRADISSACLNPPRNLRYQLVTNPSGNKQWNFQWDPPEFRSTDNAARQEMNILYDVIVNGQTVRERLTSATAEIVVADIPRNDVNGRFTVQIKAYNDNPNVVISPSFSPLQEIPVNTENSVILLDVVPGYSDAAILFTPLEGTVFYTINYTYIDPSGTRSPAKKVVGAAECTEVNGKLVYTLKNLIHGGVYDISIGSDAPGAAYDSVTKRVTINGTLEEPDDPNNPNNPTDPSNPNNPTRPPVLGGITMYIRGVTEKQAIKLTWDAIEGATGYRLYRTGGSGQQFPISGNCLWSGTDTEFTDSFVDYGYNYTYTVVAVKFEEGAEAQIGSSYPYTTSLKFSLNAVQGLSIKSADKAVILTWEKVEGASGYYVQYQDDNGTWVTVANVSTTTCTVSNLENNLVRNYRVIPFAIINGSAVPFDKDALVVSGRAGVKLPAPVDFTAVAGEGQVTLSWSSVDGADGYEIYVISTHGTHTLDRVSKTSAVHLNIPNGTTITYMVRAYKYVDGEMLYGDNSLTQSATVGVVLDTPTDVTASSSSDAIDLKWKKVNNADGYVVYGYNMAQMKFTPLGIVTAESFTHNGLQTGREYTYMIAAYKNVDGSPLYSGYSLAVTATATDGGTGRPGDNSSSVAGDHRIYITGTTPYGMTNSNLISAFTEKGAFDTDIDVRFTNSPDTVKSIQNVLNFYGEGIESFMIYPMDIALYEAGTDNKVFVKPGYYMTLTIPVPDELLPYSEHISVVHVSDLDKLEILPSIHVDVNGVDCIQFTANSFSPYAFVVYMNEVAEDTGAGTAASAEGSTDTPSTPSPVFRCTYLRDIYRRRARNKIYKRVAPAMLHG